MNNRNKTTRTFLRWTYLLVGFLIGVFVYTPARDDEAFVLLMQVAVVPAVTLTGVWIVYVFAVTQLSYRLLDRLNLGGGLKVDELENVYAFAFPGSAERVTKLVELVNAKRACLPFLTFKLVFEPDLAMLRLRRAV